MLTRKRVRKVLFWGTFFLLTCMGGVIGFAYWYVTDSVTVAKLIRTEGKRYLPGSDVILGHADLRLFPGELIFRSLQLNQRVDGAPFITLKLPWMKIQYNTRAILKKQFAPGEIIISQPTLRLRRRKDGTWNLQGLLADPWPGPMMKTPPILIRNGTVELVDGEAPGSDVTLLRDVMLSIKPKEDADKQVEFEGSANGDQFDHLNLRGTVDLGTGRLTIDGGDVTRLAISETLRSRIPADLRAHVDQVGLTGGEVDLRVAQVTYDKQATPPIHYDVAAQIRSAVWNCPNLPFPINELSASLSARDGELRVERASGVNGLTSVKIEDSRIELGGDPARAPFNLNLSAKDLELDKRLRAKTPPQFLSIWRDYSPSGRVDAALKLVRKTEGGKVGFSWAVDCRDVGMNCRFFKYPLDHIWGRLICENNQIRVNAQTVVGGRPLTAKGTIDNPGDYAHVELDFQADALPIDEALFDAIPPDVRKRVDEFHPTGTVAGKAHLTRTRNGPAEPPEGKVEVHAKLRLNEHCAIRWDGLPYPVSNLTGELELHPNEWIFTNVHGSNGQAEITGSGKVVKLPDAGPRERLVVDLRMRAEKLPFDDQLYHALQPAWQKSWKTLNPYGSSSVEAEIHLHPDRPDQYHLVINPQPETSVQLKFGPPAQPGTKDQSGIFTLRMDKVTGRFVSDNGVVKMEDVGFFFYGSPVKFSKGQVEVEDSGEFKLDVKQVEVDKLRLDQEDLVTIMPPVMKDFARRLDQGRPISTIKGNLGLSWSGKLGESVHCNWDDVLVVLNGNMIQAGIPLEHMQGQLDHVQGKFDGQSLEVGGALNLLSVSLLGQQVTALKSPFQVSQGRASLSNIRGKLLGGEVTGRFGVSLDATPQYAAELTVQDADLKRYAETLSGHQSYSGLVSGWLALSGMGTDLKNLQGSGEAHVVDGNLGELPFVLKLIDALKPKFKGSKTPTLFDRADVSLKIQNGASILDPIKLTGNVISFQGKGKMDVQGQLDLILNPIAGRGRFPVPILSDALREASGQVLVVRARGPIAYPKVEIGPFPGVTDTVRMLGRRPSAN